MSTELDNYLTDMNKVYDEALMNVKLEKIENPSKNFLALLLDNNQEIQKYITHFSIGTGISDEEDNKTASKALLKKHIEFMNFMWSI